MKTDIFSGEPIIYLYYICLEEGNYTYYFS